MQSVDAPLPGRVHGCSTGAPTGGAHLQGRLIQARKHLACPHRGKLRHRQHLLRAICRGELCAVEAVEAVREREVEGEREEDVADRELLREGDVKLAVAGVLRPLQLHCTAPRRAFRSRSWVRSLLHGDHAHLAQSLHRTLQPAQLRPLWRVYG